MASNTEAYFFKAENSTLTVEDIRKEGYIAGEASNGFIEVTQNETLESSLHLLGRLPILSSDREEDWKLRRKQLETFLMNGLKDGSPRLMYCSSSSFGGCMDDGILLKAYNPDGTVEKARDNFQSDSKAEQLFFKEYNVSGYFDTVGFARYTTDHKTEDQKLEIKLLNKEFEDKQYKEWKDSQPDLDIARISLFAIKTAQTGNSYYSNNSEYNNLPFMKRFIREHYNVEDED